MGSWYHELFCINFFVRVSWCDHFDLRSWDSLNYTCDQILGEPPTSRAFVLATYRICFKSLFRMNSHRLAYCQFYVRKASCSPWMVCVDLTYRFAVVSYAHTELGVLFGSHCSPHFGYVSLHVICIEGGWAWKRFYLLMHIQRYCSFQKRMIVSTSYIVYWTPRPDRHVLYTYV